ncbi:MAG: hypothetical protein K6E38_01380 [Fretibacterium sp.]|nr:hypothetical protein [Fretibacterium sp.]
MRYALRAAIIVWALFSAGTAFGGVQDFGPFTLSIPKGWTAEKQSEGEIVTANVFSPDESFAFTFTLCPLMGLSLEETARSFSEGMGGTKPQLDKNGAYRFTFNEGASAALVSGRLQELGYYMLVTMTGDVKGNLDAVNGLIDSLEIK